MATIVEVYGLRAVQPVSPTSLLKLAPTGVTVPSMELIGIEVEVENYAPKLGELNRAWNVTTDGSLRNNGAELVSKPFMAAHAPAMLNYLFNGYLSDQCFFGPRTSVHVHLNVQDLTKEQVFNIIMLYAVYERLLYKFAGRGRQKNVYCVPLFDCDLLVYMLELDDARVRSWSKYTGLNILPMMEYGTIEFRHMHGTTDVKKLCTWINLITRLKEFVKVTPTKRIREVIAQMNDTFDFGGFMHEVFGDYAGELLYEGPHDLNYLQVKQALASRQGLRNLVIQAKPASSFFKFKEQ